MATNILKLPIARVAYRGLASQAAASAAEAPKSECEPPKPAAISCTMLPNKILVSSQDLCGGLSRLSVAFRTGPRNEVGKNVGISHLLRTLTGASTLHFTDFFIVRNIQEYGAHLTCTGDREITMFNIVGTRDIMCNVVTFLASVVSAPAFKPWQIDNCISRMKYEVATLSPQVRTMELLHKVAFRSGLGNSLYIGKEQLGQHTPEMLRDFYNAGFTANKAAVVGYNMMHQDVVKFAESFKLGDTSTTQEGNSKYFGGELRDEYNSHFVTVAIATQSAGMKDLKEALTFAVLQHALGVQPSIKWGDSPSPLFKAVMGASPSAGASCINIAYSDAGLFGLMLTTEARNSGSVVEAAYKVLKEGSVKDEDIRRGKAMLKAKMLESASSTENLLDDIATQSLITGSIVPCTVLAEAVDKISAAEVQKAAKKIASGKFSLAGVGNMEEIPFLDELK